MPRKKTPPYSGSLGKSLQWRQVQFWGTPECFRNAEWRERYREACRADAEDFGTCWLLLLQHHGIDLAEWGGPSALELAMAAQHVPAFQNLTVKLRSGAPTMLDAIATLRLLMACDQREHEVYEAKGRRPSRYALARWAADLPWCKEIGLSDETIRKRLDDLQTAGAAYRAGKPTEFQRTFYEVLVPAVFELTGTAIPVEDAE
jgi:hypothetical protein